MPIAIAPLADSDLDAQYRIYRASWEADVPDIPFASRRSFDAMNARPWPGNDFEQYVATLDGVAAGCLRMRMPTLDNVHTAKVDVLVDPQHRRHGIGSALLAKAIERVRANGRTHLIAETTDHRPDGGAFAVAAGARAGLAETRSRLDVPPSDQTRLDDLLTESWTHAAGYELVQWVGVPPEAYLDDVAYLDSRLNLDAPQGDLTIEAEKIDGDRVRANEEHRIALGQTSWHTGVAQAGRLVAWTTVSGSDDNPTQAWQQITIVDPEHRGHRLGLIVKLENLRHVRRGRPELTAIDTFNATANDHMLAINDTMGFRRADEWMQWQLRV